MLLCLFEGVIQAIDIHLKPKTLHFEVSPGDESHRVNKDPTEDPVRWYNTIRNEDGSEDENCDWKELIVSDVNVVNITDLVNGVTTSNIIRICHANDRGGG